MVKAGQSVHLTTLFFLGKLNQAVNQYFMHIISPATDNSLLWMIQRKGGAWPLKIFHDQSSRKYGTRLGSSSWPLDLQPDSHLLPDTLPTDVFYALEVIWKAYRNRTVRQFVHSALCQVHITYIFWGRNPKFCVWTILGWRSEVYHFLVTVILTSDLVFRIIISGGISLILF